jgi:LuxR family maltose regulon positive regulatory protein
MLSDNEIYLERPHIYSLLEKAVQGPLVTVIAGAGYGKTQVVHSFVQKFRMTTAWMQFSESDNNSWRFWENFVCTIATISEESASRLGEIGFPETKRQFDRYIIIPQKDVISNEKYIFVYDDFHLIHDKTVLRFLEWSVTSYFPNITSILISRNEPAINIAGFFSKGLVTRITEDDLRFSEEEMVRYLRSRDIILSPKAARELYNDTEGWVFAIRLAGLFLKKGSADYVRSSIKNNIFNLIEGRVFAVISKDLQKYLIKLSLIDNLSAALLTELAAGETQGDSDKKLTDELEHIGFFIRFDTYLNVYRIHHLLLEYLKRRQDELTGEEKKDVYLRAARWCAANNLKMDAISYYEKAGAYDKLIEIIYTLPMALPDHITDILMDILNRAPAELYRKNAIAWILRTRFLFTLGKIEESEAEAKGIIQRFEVLPQSAFNSRVLFATYNHLGFISMISSVSTRRYDFPFYFEKAHQYCVDSPSELRGAITVINLGSYICRVGVSEPGEMEAFIDAVTASIPHIAATMNGCGYGMDDLARAELAYFKGELDSAEKFAYQALYKAQKRNQYEIENRALFYLIRLNTALGNHAKIQELFALLEAQLKVPEYSNRYVYYDIVLGWFYARIDQVEKVASWLKNDFEENELNSLLLGLEALVRTEYYMVEKKYPAALNSLESHENPFGLGAYLFGRLFMKVRAAVCHYHMGEKDKAIKALEAAYILGESNSLEMPFIEMGRDMVALAGAALMDKNHIIPQVWLEKIRRNASAYTKKFSVIVEKFRNENQVFPAPAVVLSRRERQILGDLSQGLTRERIAGAGNMSINAVKSIIRSVYHKLGAVNRADAIRIATAMGILKNGNDRTVFKSIYRKN